ncbi:MAG: hypothetical protein K2K57_05520 [Oscillospiraceae bacterium]|nr:hypothetical protein [Oscillospiraceae bacterium]
MKKKLNEKLIDEKAADVVKYISKEDCSGESKDLNTPYRKWDILANEQRMFYDHLARSDKYAEFIKAKENCAYVKYATFFRGLGVVSPSKFTKHIIGGYKRGRIIKNNADKKFVNKIYYDRNNMPVCIECFCGFDKNDPGVKIPVHETFFTEYNGCRWTVSYFTESKKIFKDFDCYKIAEKDGRLLGLYELECSGETAIISSEEYDYSDIDDKVIWCTYSNYVEGLSGSSKDIPPGFKHSPMEEWKFKIYLNEKGKFAKYEMYKNIEGCFKFVHEKMLIKS